MHERKMNVKKGIRTHSLWIRKSQDLNPRKIPLTTSNGEKYNDGSWSWQLRHPVALEINFKNDPEARNFSFNFDRIIVILSLRSCDSRFNAGEQTWKWSIVAKFQASDLTNDFSWLHSPIFNLNATKIKGSDENSRVNWALKDLLSKRELTRLGAFSTPSNYLVALEMAMVIHDWMVLYFHSSQHYQLWMNTI